MAGISPGDPPGGRSARRRRRRALIAAAAALAVVFAVLMTGCGSRGSPGTQASPAPASTSPTPSPTGLAARLHKLTDQELRAWAAALPKGPVPDVPTLTGRQGHFLLVDRGHRVPVPADAGQLYVWWRTPYGLVTPLLAAGVGYSDDYWGSYIELLRPDGRLVQIGHGLMGGVATDPTGRYVAWLQAPPKESPNTVHVVDLAAMREVTRFDEPAFSSLRGFVQAGILIEKGPGFVVRSLDGREVRHRQGLEGAAGNRLLVREGNCLRVIELGSAFRTAPFGRRHLDPARRPRAGRHPRAGPHHVPPRPEAAAGEGVRQQLPHDRRCGVRPARRALPEGPGTVLWPDLVTRPGPAPTADTGRLRPAGQAAGVAAGAGESAIEDAGETWLHANYRLTGMTAIRHA